MLLLVAASMRPVLASIGPVLPELRADLRLSGTQVAVMAGLGVFCLGALAPIAPWPARRWGPDRVLAGALLAVVVGLLLRTTAGALVLFAGTIVACAGVAVANVLMPAIVKRDHGANLAAAMGLYTMVLTGSAALAAGTTAPLGELTGLGWRGALGAWALPAAAALAAWAWWAAGTGRPPAVPPTLGNARDALAWQVAAFFGLVGLNFHGLLVWLPSVYRAEGLSSSKAGALLSILIIVQVPVTLVTPRYAVRGQDQRRTIAAATVLTGIGLTGVLLAPTVLPVLWIVVLGVGQGACFAVSMLLFVLRTRHSEDTARLSAFAQTTGYLIAALGPLLLGALHDVTASWTPALLVLVALLVPQLAVGLLAGRARYVRTT